MVDAQLRAFQERLRQGPGPTLVGEVERAVVARQKEPGGHAGWARLCEEVGLLGLAFREYQLAFRDNPEDSASAFRLAHFHRERGEAGRALALLQPLLAAEPAREEWLALYAGAAADEGATPRLRDALAAAVRAGLPPERARALADAAGPHEEEAKATAEPAALSPGDADCARFHALFAGREDVHARQWARGEEAGYSPVSEPLTPAVVRQHLLGTYTVGVYPIRLDGTCTFFAVDLDIDRAALAKAHGRPEEARRLRSLLRGSAARVLGALHSLGLAPLFEDSGYKGRHFWVFLEQPESAEVLHALGRLALAWLGPALPAGLHLEFFPKQASRGGKGLGNLIKLPLGIHRRTGRRAALLDDGGQALPEPLAALRQVVRLPRPALYAAIEQLKALAAAPTAPAPTPPVSREVPSVEPNRPAVGPPPDRAPAWTDADFDTDPRVRHLLAHCPVLAELRRAAVDTRRLSHEEQLVLIHTLGHLEGGPQAVNYLLQRCVDVGPEKLLKDRLKGNPVSCPSIRKKIGHVTRRVKCNCPFDFAPDRYPTPVLHLLTLPAESTPSPIPAPAEAPEALARRYAALTLRRAEIEQEHDAMRRALIAALSLLPERAVVVPGGRYQVREEEGIVELLWLPDKTE